MGLSQRAYARHRGCDPKAVRKALAAGRITALPDGTIDPGQADRDWAANTDQGAQRERAARNVAANQAKPKPDQAVDPARTDVANRPQEPATTKRVKRGSEAATFAAARAENESLKARERRLRLEEREGKLVDRDRAKTLFFDMARQFRDALQGQPARVAAEMAATLGTDPHRVQSELERFVRQFLTELADPSFDLGRAK